jgi:hypothetical protein
MLRHESLLPWRQLLGRMKMGCVLLGCVLLLGCELLLGCVLLRLHHTAAAGT